MAAFADKIRFGAVGKLIKAFMIIFAGNYQIFLFQKRYIAIYRGFIRTRSFY